MSLETKPLVAILDGNAIIHRAFHALPPLTTKEGTLVNAVYGFTTTLFKIIKDLHPTHLVATFDVKEKTFRHEQYVEYKAQRVAAPQELYDQIVITKQVLDALNIKYFEAPGFEADDIIATISKKLSDDDIEVAIITGDLDTLQLVDNNISVYTFHKGFSEIVKYTPLSVKERFGFGPEGMVHYKALRGDPSDNIPGVRGVGEKTAGGLIKEFKTIANLYKQLDGKKAKDVSVKLNKLLLDNKKEVLHSLDLVTLRFDVPIKFSLVDTELQQPNAKQAFVLFQKLEFKSLLNRLDQIFASFKQTNVKPAPATLFSTPSLSSNKKIKQDYQTITDAEGLKLLINKLKGVNRLSVDTETTGLDPLTCRLLGISFCWLAGQAYFVSTADEQFLTLALKELKSILQDPKIAKVGHNLKYDWRVLQKYNVNLAGIKEDTLVAAYLLSRTNRSLKLDDLVFAELGYRMQSLYELVTGQKNPSAKEKRNLDITQVPVTKLGWYSAEDADFALRLADHLNPHLQEDGLDNLYHELEVPLTPILGDMEQNGVLIDSDYLKLLSKNLHQQLSKVTQKIYKLVGTEFNINSPQQIKEILFTKLELSNKGLRKTAKGGNTSTAADELEKLVDAHPVVPVILEYRELNKLLNTYIDALPELVSKVDGRVHTSFNQTVTATGRLSSSDPNLQNIPIRTSTGKKIRYAFMADRGCRLVGADYSQIELRVIASIAEDKAMLTAFQRGEDIHRRTAAAVFNKKIDEVTSGERRIAKEINFGIIYGLGATGLAQRTGLKFAEAKFFIQQYFKMHPHIKQWLDNIKVQAAEDGYVQTILGRRRYLPDLNSGVPYLRAAAERMAVNMPIQGTAADLIKLAMINVAAALPKISPQAKLILQVHDELLVECPTEDADQVAKLVKEEMESVYKIKAPIKAEVHVAKRWGEMKD